MARAQAPPPPSVTLSPSIARGVAKPGLRVGPFSIRNGTGRDYRLRMFPVLLGQRRDGGLFVRLDEPARRRARALMTATSKRADFPVGAGAGASALVRRIPDRHSLYGGLLFEAAPRARKGARPEQIVAVLALNARILLDPPLHLRRVRFTSEPIRAEPAGRGRLALRVPVKNVGNTFIRAGGTVTARNGAGAAVFRGRLTGVEVLPGAVVELTRELAKPLPPGRYTLRADLHAGARRFVAAGSMRLVGAGEVAGPSARLTAFDPPEAHRGETATLEADFRNTGNVPFRPQASFEIRATAESGAGVLRRRIPARASAVGPGESGNVSADYDVPANGGPFEVTVRLARHGRPMDERTVSVTPTAAPSALGRARDFIIRNALVLLAVGAIALLVLVVAGALYVRKLKAAARTGGAIKTEPRLPER